MHRPSIGFAACLILILASGGPLRADPKPQGDPGRGAKFYSDNCARCHNARPPMEHRDREWSVVMIHMRVSARLPGAQARDIEAFLQASNNPPRPASLERPGRAAELSGRTLVEQYGCKGCHVIDGVGGTIGPNLDGVFARRDESWIRVQIANPREHKPDSIMPFLGLSNEQVNAIIEFLREGK